MRIIAEKIQGDWSAWEESEPTTAFDGSGAIMAVIRLCNELGLDRSQLAPDRQACRTDHLEFVYGKSCPDCRGSGRYVGLTTTDVCETCAGSGHVSA